MKKIVIFFIGILVIILGLIIYIDNNDERYTSKIMDSIISNTDINNINYINKYDNYYIVTDKDNIYLINNKYELILKKDINLIHKNNNNYDIIYKNDYLMYVNDYIKDNVLVYEYYDINTYELIDRVFVGGNLNE